jgi:hypothetical protein
MSIRLPAAAWLIMAVMGQALVSSAAQQTDSPRAGSNQAPKARAKAKAAAKVDDATPEAAWRSFVIAMLSRDEATLKTVALPADGIEWLVKGELPPADALPQIREHIAKLPIRRLIPGDRFTLPRGRVIIVEPEEVGPERAVIVPEGDPFPTRLHRVAGHWKVDARPVIAARKAADAAKKKAESRKTPGPG